VRITMNYTDGIEEYEATGFHEDARQLEKAAEPVLARIASGSMFPGSFLPQEEAKDFIIKVEKWKANCSKKRMGHARKNRKGDVWEALVDSASACDDRAKLLAVMGLIGFGRSRDPETGLRSGKVASAVLRFLYPEEWGVVDWRNAVSLRLLREHDWDISIAFEKARGLEADDLREEFKQIPEDEVVRMNLDYRRIRDSNKEVLPRTADVDMALFGLSLKLWPMRS